MVVWADEISKLQDPCEEELCWEGFKYFNHIWDPFTIDRAASWATCKVFHPASGRKVFNSRFATRESQGICMLLQCDWGIHANYINAPYHLIEAVTHTLRRQQAYGVLLTPDRASSTWWPLAQLDSPGVMGVVTLPDKDGLFLRTGKPLPRPPWRVRAVLFDFRPME